ncbi:MAG: hypothetical protein AABX89_06335 [Candidatus Thermoplasmatota archaeon]
MMGMEAANSSAGPRFQFTDRKTFYWKVGLLAATTVALIPILLWKHEMAATIYLVILAAIHVGGLFIVVKGVKKEQIAPNKRGLIIRIIGIVLLVVLLYLVSKGLQDPALGLLFWGSLFSIWALHTAGLALVHIRGRNEAAMCPFV